MLTDAMMVDMREDLKRSNDGNTAVYDDAAISLALDEIVELRARVEELEGERVRKFPIQRTGYGEEPMRTHAPIPWAVAERAYAAYAGKYGKDQSLERLAQRGGFSCGEMDMLAPGWEAECTSASDLEARVACLRKALRILARLETRIDPVMRLSIDVSDDERRDVCSALSWAVSASKEGGA